MLVEIEMRGTTVDHRDGREMKFSSMARFQKGNRVISNGFEL